VDVVGGLNIKKHYGDQALAIFVQPPSVEELKNRLRNRSTESEEKINMRIAKAEKELSYAGRFDLIIINDNLESALKIVESRVAEFLSEDEQE
jgi:guanylate kinase